MKKIPMLDLRLEYHYMKNDIDSAISRCLEHQQWIFGPETKNLEEEIGTYLGSAHCIGTSSGTEALVLALRALAIKQKGREYFEKTDEIITTSFTFTATGDAILRTGATPVFVDIDPGTYNIDSGAIREYLAHKESMASLQSGRVAGIIPVHLYGKACNMDEIMDIAKEYNLFVLEDVAQAFGGEWNGRKLGTIGTAGAFSFFPSKNLGGFGDAGMISTEDPELAELTRMLLKHGGKDKYNVDHIGYNARLDTLQAAVILAKLKYVDEFNGRRRTVAAEYDRNLSSVDISLPLGDPSHVYHQYTVRVRPGERKELQQALAEDGIGSMVYYPVPLHQMKVFDGRCKTAGSLKNAEAAAQEVLSLPIEPLMEENDVSTVIGAIKKFAGNRRISDVFAAAGKS